MIQINRSSSPTSPPFPEEQLAGTFPSDPIERVQCFLARHRRKVSEGLFEPPGGFKS